LGLEGIRGLTAAIPSKGMTLKQFKGRKFRDIELDVEEPESESLDSSKGLTSNE